MSLDASAEQVFLTDGTTFIGPYLVGSFDIAHGTRTLRENYGAVEVFAIKGTTLEEAKRTWSRRGRNNKPRPLRTLPGDA